MPEKVFRPESPHSILNIESRPLLREAPIGRAADRDDNKYKRKTPQEIFSRWSRLDNSTLFLLQSVTKYVSDNSILLLLDRLGVELGF